MVVVLPDPFLRMKKTPRTTNYQATPTYHRGGVVSYPYAGQIKMVEMAKLRESFGCVIGAVRIFSCEHVQRNAEPVPSWAGEPGQTSGQVVDSTKTGATDESKYNYYIIFCGLTITDRHKPTTTNQLTINQT